MSYRRDPGQRAPESRARDPRKYKGVRCRLRTQLRAAGLTGKITTDIWRHPETHIVVCIDYDADHELVPLTFEGLTVRLHMRKPA